MSFSSRSFGLLIAASIGVGGGAAQAATVAHPLTLTQQPTGTMHTQNDAIIGVDGKQVRMHGFSWFGFNNGQTMLDGLWTGDPMGGDFATVVARLKNLGFNAVRLPFSFKDLNTLVPRSFARSCTLPAPAQLAASITAPGAQPSPFVPLTAPPQRSPGTCNDYLPTTSTFDRFVWVVKFFTHNGFYVLADNHLREDKTALEDPQQWVENWSQLLEALVDQDPITRSRLALDLLNEPDNSGVKWPHQDDGRGLQDLYLSAMDALYPIAPVLFFIEGTGQGGLQSNWGDGFATDASLLAAHPGVSDANPFFTALSVRSYRHHVVLAPHVYGPEVTTNPQASSGAPLFARLSNSFGHFTRAGYHGLRLPVAIGEFGSKFAAADDQATMADLASYLRLDPVADDGQHNPILNWFYWCYNADSGDTGGLVQDDWITLNQTKLAYLRQLGLGSAAAPAAVVTGPVAAPAAPAPAPAPTPASTPAPTPAPTPAAPAPAAGGAQSRCCVRVHQTPSWAVAGGQSATLSLQVQNSGQVGFGVPWTLSLHAPSYFGASNVWGWTITQSGNGYLTGASNESWEVLPPGAAVNIGVNVLATSAQMLPQQAVLNGIACDIVGL